jgi:hypothetical protein
MDLDEVLREIAIRHIVGDWDSWGYRRGKNSLIYQRPSDGRMVLIPWDIDFVLGSGDGPTSSLTSTSLYGFNRFFQEFGGEYQDVLEDIARKALVSEALDGYLDRTYELFQLEGVGASSPARIKTFLNARRNFILGPPVAITTNGGAPLITSDPSVMLSGSSPFDAETMFLNGVQQTPEWTSPTSWVLPGVIEFGEHIYQVEFFDSDGLSVGSDEISIILNPFVIHSVSEDESGAEISWYSVPRREYSVYGGDVPDGLQLLAQNIESEGADTSYIDPLAIGEASRFYQVVLQSPVWQPGLKGEYFTGMNFENLSLTRIDQQVDFEWGQGSPGPGMPSDNFSVRWTGSIEIKTEGNYTFWTTSDDGVRLKVDDALVIENWTDHGPTVDGGSRVLSEGFHDLVLEFYERGGGAVIHLEYQGPGIPRQVIPGGTLLHIP